MQGKWPERVNMQLSGKKCYSFTNTECRNQMCYWFELIIVHTLKIYIVYGILGMKGLISKCIYHKSNTYYITTFMDKHIGKQIWCICIDYCIVWDFGASRMKGLIPKNPLILNKIHCTYPFSWIKTVESI